VIRLIADENTSHRLVEACRRLDRLFPLTHMADWQEGRHREAEDHAILQALRVEQSILVSFDRRTIAMHAGDLTKSGAGHSGVILFRRSVLQNDYGKQSRLLVGFWREAADWDWADRIQYLPR
jgi:hypothetical protein